MCCWHYRRRKTSPSTKTPTPWQISFIFPAWVTRFDERLFGDFIRQTLREETPAHLHVHPLWLSQEDMPAFESAYQDWLGNLGMDTGNTKVRDARDRLINWLGMGMPYPLRDLELQYVPMVALDQQADIHILGAQTGVRYILCDENGDPIVHGQGKPLFSVLRETSQAADQVTLPTPKIVKDITFTILASRESNVRKIPLQPPLETYLNKPVSIKAGIDTALQVTFVPAEGQSVTDHQITINYKDTVTVAIEASQAGISYKLVDAKENDISASEQGKKEAGITLKSNVLMEDIEITIKAFRTLEPNPTADLKTRLSVKVRPNPAVTVGVEPSTIDYAAQTTLTLTGAQSSTKYQLYKRDLIPADYGAPVTDDPIEVAKRIKTRNYPDGFVPVGLFQEESGKPPISTVSLSEDTLFIVQATKKENKEALWLEQAVVVLVKPNMAPKVGAKAPSIPANTEGMVTVSGTQKGVMYQLRLDDDTPVNESGFHWEDRGIETMRVEVDFVVEAPGDPVDYQTLLLPTGALKAETTFNVLATKVLTELNAPLTGKVTIGIG